MRASVVAVALQAGDSLLQNAKIDLGLSLTNEILILARAVSNVLQMQDTL